MALSTAWATGSAATVTTSATFIPELWSDDIIAGYKQNLVVGNLVSKISHNGQKGSVINIPSPVRGTASAKAAEGQVTLIANTEGEVTVTIDQHYEYSRLIEDIAAIQALDSMRRFYTDDAGYALARQVDWALHMRGTGFQGGTYNAVAIGLTTATYDAALVGDGATAWDSSAASSAGNAADLTDAGIRNLIQLLDDADVPQDNRYLVVPPSQRNVLMGIARFTEQAFVGEVGGQNTIRNGRIGDIYGVEVYVSTNCPAIAADDTTVDQKVAMLFHRDALVFAEQLSVRSQTQYKQEYLSDLMTSDTIYGYPARS
jgi:hypothetical protein